MRTKQPPQENELKEACQSVKNDHPDFGVKRVFKELEQRKPRWRLTEKRVQKCMKKYGLTCKSRRRHPYETTRRQHQQFFRRTAFA